MTSWLCDALYEDSMIAISLAFLNLISFDYCKRNGVVSRGWTKLRLSAGTHRRLPQIDRQEQSQTHPPLTCSTAIT